MKRMLLASLAVFALVATPALARGPARHDYIAFANQGGVSTWRTDGDRTIYFEDDHHHWYKAVLFSPAFDINFREKLAIDTSPGGSLDKWSAVIVRGQRIPFTSFERIAGKPPKSAH